MKLRNLILLPIAALTTAVPTLTLASCNKDPQPKPVEEDAELCFTIKSVTAKLGLHFEKYFNEDFVSSLSNLI